MLFLDILLYINKYKYSHVYPCVFPFLRPQAAAGIRDESFRWESAEIPYVINQAAFGRFLTLLTKLPLVG